MLLNVEALRCLPEWHAKEMLDSLQASGREESTVIQAVVQAAFWTT